MKPFEADQLRALRAILCDAIDRALVASSAAPAGPENPACHHLWFKRDHDACPVCPEIAAAREAGRRERDAEVAALQDCLALAKAEKDAYKRDFEAELAGARDQREKYGAREDETMLEFIARLADDAHQIPILEQYLDEAERQFQEKVADLARVTAERDQEKERCGELANLLQDIGSTLMDADRACNGDKLETLPGAVKLLLRDYAVIKAERGEWADGQAALAGQLAEAQAERDESKAHLAVSQLRAQSAEALWKAAQAEMERLNPENQPCSVFCNYPTQPAKYHNDFCPRRIAADPVAASQAVLDVRAELTDTHAAGRREGIEAAAMWCKNKANYLEQDADRLWEAGITPADSERFGEDALKSACDAIRSLLSEPEKLTPNCSFCGNGRRVNAVGGGIAPCPKCSEPAASPAKEERVGILAAAKILEGFASGRWVANGQKAKRLLRRAAADLRTIAETPPQASQEAARQASPEADNSALKASEAAASGAGGDLVARLRKAAVLYYGVGGRLRALATEAADALEGAE